jgi:hypothetical protein
MVLAAVVWEAVCCDRLFSRAEKQRLVDILRKRLQRLST